MHTFVTAAASALLLSTAFAGSSTNSSCSYGSKCKSFTIDVTFGPSSAKNALSRNAILTNGSLPGPPLLLTQGDCVDFTVINNMANATGVHFHGIRQLDTPWSDGVPGVSQYSIQPGKSYNYRWTADEAGTYFYHSHYKSQMMDGLYGAIIIAPAKNSQTPFSQINGDLSQIEAAVAKIEPVFVSDWSSFTAGELLAYERAANVDAACSDSIVFNGKGSSYCLTSSQLTANQAPQVPQLLNGTSLTAKGCIPASNKLVQGAFAQTLSALPPKAYDVCTAYTGSNYTYKVDAKNGWAAMTFISPAGIALFKLTIDGHKMYVYEQNGHYITPQVVDQFSLSNGDRISVLVKLDQPAADYTIRAANAGINQVLSGFGVLSYAGSSGPASANLAAMNLGGQNLTTLVSFKPALAAPFPAPEVPVSQSADATFVLDITKTPNAGEAWSWVLNGVEPYSESRDDEAPPLLFQGPASIPDSDLVLRTQYNQWVDLIIKIAGPLAQPHPIHKHANKFFVIGAGTGDFNYTSVAAAQAAGLPFNLQTPPYVDGFTSPPNQGAGSWMVFRYQANTPGAWLLHCHVQTHFSGGMALAILDGVDKFPSVPGDAGSSCAAGGTTDHAVTVSNGSGNGYGNSGATGTAAGTGVGVATATATAYATGGNGAATGTSTGVTAQFTGGATSVSGLGQSALALLALLSVAVMRL